MIEIGPLDALKGRIGHEIAVSDWLAVTQERINAFAAATGDDQWIHVDPARAAASPFTTTIAHGFLTLSLVSLLVRSTVMFPPQRMAINYGVNRVRFITPVPAGARIRARIAPKAVEDVEGGIQVTWDVTLEREAAEKPCAVVEWIVRYYPAETTEHTEGTA
jgi:acyl dehydratase